MARRSAFDVCLVPGGGAPFPANTHHDTMIRILDGRSTSSPKSPRLFCMIPDSIHDYFNNAKSSAYLVLSQHAFQLLCYI
jgi:hypothetical protein